MANHFRRAEGLFTLASDGKSEGYRIRVAPPTARVSVCMRVYVPYQLGKGWFGPPLGCIPQQTSLAVVTRYGCVRAREVKKTYPSALGVEYSFEERREAWGKILSVGGPSNGVFHGFYYSGDILKDLS